MSPTPTPGADLRLGQERGVKQGGGGREAGVGRRCGETSQQGRPKCLSSGTELPSLLSQDGESHRPEQGIAPSSPLSSFYRRTHAYGDFPTITIGFQEERRSSKGNETGREDWGSQSLGCPPRAEGQQETLVS